VVLFEVPEELKLFRQKALDEQRDKLHGAVIVLPRLSHSWICGSIVFWLTVGVYLLTTLNYARKETVSGWLEPVDGVVRIYAVNEGKVARLLVDEGSHVIEGQPLAVINGDRVLTDGQHLETLLLGQYEEQKLTLERQLERTEGIARRRSEDIAQQIAAAENELNWIESQLVTVKDRRGLLGKRIAMHKRLATDGHISQLELDALRDQSLRLDSEIQMTSMSRVQHIDTIQQLVVKQALLPESSAEQLDNIRFRLIDISREIARLRGNRSYVLKASRGGVISNLQVQEGQWVRFNLPLMSIVPSDKNLVARLFVPVRAAGFVSLGQEIRIRYDAYPYQKFGSYVGTVIGMSESVILPDEIFPAPVIAREPVYKISAQLKSGVVNAYGVNIALKPGMTLSADIKLGDRTILQWLLDPIFSLRGRL
jgi:membrane fusion protein